MTPALAQTGGELAGRRIVLGITGGIAAYKSCELVRLLRAEGAQVQVVMTSAARQFVGVATLQALSGLPVFDDLWDARCTDGMAHIGLSRDADAILVAPASADFIAKVAGGAGDDLLSTLVLARRREHCRLLLAPAMNVEMWEHPATQRNAAQARADGAWILGPAHGDQACGEVGAGRMLEPAQIVTDCIAAFHDQCLRGRSVLLTAGPTFEPIDPVRGITNRSSGKMGYALARAAREAGAQVTLVSGPTALPAPHGVRVVAVDTAAQMLEQVLAAVDQADVFLAVAAVADWRAAAPSPTKLKKRASAEPPTLQLANNPDILATVAALPSPPLCVGFAAESEKLLEHARAKLSSKGVAMIVANLVQETLGSDAAELLVVDAASAQKLPRADKLAQARRIVALVAARLAAGLPPAPDAGEPAPGTADPHPGRAPARRDARLCHRGLGRHRPARVHRRAAGPGAGSQHARAGGLCHPPGRPRPGRRRAATLGPGPPPRHRAGQPRGPDRLRLPGPADGLALEPQFADAQDRTAGARGAAGGDRRASGTAAHRGLVRGERARQRRFWEHGYAVAGDAKERSPSPLPRCVPERGNGCCGPPGSYSIRTQVCERPSREMPSR